MAGFVSSVLIFFGYLLGSIPTGYLAGKLLKGIDIRECGSGSIGATNILRTLGKGPAIAVLAIDVFKGMLAVGLIKFCYLFTAAAIVPLSWQPWLVAGAAIAAVLGHSRSIFLNFTGGKSVATGLGVLLVMNPVVALGTLASFLLMLGISRIVSLSSITGAIAVNLLAILLHQPLPYCFFAAVAGLYVIIRHRGNISRLMAGEEPKLGQKLQQER